MNRWWEAEGHSMYDGDVGRSLRILDLAAGRRVYLSSRLLHRCRNPADDAAARQHCVFWSGKLLLVVSNQRSSRPR